VNKTARVMKNLKNNPIVTFTIDKTHPIDPMQNEGIMVEAKTHPNKAKLEIKQCYNKIQNKYGIDIATKILGMEVLSDYVSIRATPTKIVYWKGPFFRKFECQKRKYKITEK
jgi:hypothetical protein